MRRFVLFTLLALTGCARSRSAYYPAESRADVRADVARLVHSLARADSLERLGDRPGAWNWYAEALSLAEPYTALPTDSAAIGHAIDVVGADWDLRPDSVRRNPYWSETDCGSDAQTSTCLAQVARLTDPLDAWIPMRGAGSGPPVSITGTGFTVQGMWHIPGPFRHWYWTPASLAEIRVRHEQREYGREPVMFTWGERDWLELYLSGQPAGLGRLLEERRRLW